ncbi:hypothetical protein [Aeromonas salmonicida]|uniref:hypothetical protein n=1 Tax=Aeromonas salmonicida TaxID=645 RepID=UPI0029BC10A9|nr:hypothetical protein [Aeromonas salmonicida]HEH9422348.1 hypothetical protein [Aeromonas salmonicida]HEH9435407.1 hypothetical protein [Aeromonas salmonicida]
MDSIDKPKQTTRQFLTKEFVVFTSQILVFFFVAVLTSSFLSDEKALAELAATKINNGSLKELLLTFSAILFVIGCFTTVQKLTDSELVNELIDEILFELPKTIYFFGSSISGVMLALATFIAFSTTEDNNSTKGYFIITIMFAIMAFCYGATVSYLLKRKTQIAPPKPDKADKPD